MISGSFKSRHFFHCSHAAMPRPRTTDRTGRVLRNFPVSILAIATALILTGAQSFALSDHPQQNAIYGAKLEGFRYPWPVLHYRLTSQHQILDMAYMDVRPVQTNGHVAVLLHGKNFCSATWQTTIVALRDAGYRVIAPDQIGFCKSTKPVSYQYSFQQLAANTHALLAAAGVSHAIIIGHSTGGCWRRATH